MPVRRTEPEPPTTFLEKLNARVNSVLRTIVLNPTVQQVKPLFNFAASILEYIPNPGDSPMQIGAKALAIANKIESKFVPERAALSTYCEAAELISMQNELFPAMFFATKLHEEFEIVPRLIDSQLVHEAINPTFGRFLFLEKYEKSYGSTFYCSKGMDFTQVMNRLWDLYGGHLSFEFSWGSKAFTTFAPIQNPLYGTDKLRMDKLVARYRKRQVDGRTSAMMFWGEPGTGKTSFAIAFAEKLGSRLMRIDANSFAVISVSEMVFLLDALQPEFIIIDDVDKADLHRGLPAVLGVLQEIKARKAKTSILMTANTVKDFDKGLLRPNRIDTFVKFAPPDYAQREAIMRGYLGDAKIEVSDQAVHRLVELSDTLTHDYIREIAELLGYEDDEDEVVEIISTMQELLHLKDQDPDAAVPALSATAVHTEPMEPRQEKKPKFPNGKTTNFAIPAGPK